ncbi:MAG: 3D domain-containing protein [Candidatus Magasanikbacteria bacterium]|nr:3D domain-containing protein [Candidatus Magasanikbacteria bacterium]
MSKIRQTENRALTILALLSLILPYPGLAAQGTAVFADTSEKTDGNELVLREAPAGKLIRTPARELTNETSPDQVVRAVITAYTSTPDQTDDSPFIAASGKQVYDGMVAANWLPFGTKIKIPALYGDKIFTVDDRMNPRYGRGRLDIWLNTPRAEAKKFGVQRVAVEIYYPVKQLARR